jgi:hypothetical protein
MAGAFSPNLLKKAGFPAGNMTVFDGMIGP